MRTKALALILLGLIVLLNACAPLTNPSPTGEVTTPEVESPPVSIYQPLAVDQVNVEVGVGSPIPVQVIASGSLPDTCAQIELMQLKQEGSNFDITLSTVPASAGGCIQDTLPFRISIPLNIVNLPAGSYSVNVNGSRADFEVDTANTTSSQPSADSVIKKEDVQVPNVNVEVGVGSPIPVHAVVGVNLPNSCAQLGEIRLHRDGTTFNVRLIADIAEREDCRADSIPFRLEIPLNVVNLPEGPYEVNVNGVTASFDPLAQPPGPADLGDFESRLQAALTQRDAQELQALIGERFVMAFWQSEGVSIPAGEAVAQLLEGYIGESNSITFHQFQDLPGFDLQAMVGPDVELAKAILATGWGLDGKGEALLLIARRPDGSLFWHSVLISQKGFSPQTGGVCSDPVDITVVDGQVSYNGISFHLDPALGSSVAAQTCPAIPLAADQPPGEAHPPYTAFLFPGFDRQNVDFPPEIRVYELTGNLQEYPYPIGAIGDLQMTIDERPEPITWFNGAALHARQAYLDFLSGAGVRGLIQYQQDIFFFTNNGLLYEFQGLTQDGRYYVNARYPLHVSFLMELAEPFTLPPNNLNPEAIPVPEWPSDFEQQRQVIEAYNAEALSRLEQISDSDPSPDIALLDALVQSIQVGSP